MNANAAVKMPAKPAKGLGKGLSALMSEGYSQTLSAQRLAPPSAAAQPPQNQASGGTMQLGVELLIAGQYQPRRRFSEEYLHELADSIEKNGIMQPILVRPHPVTAGSFEIIAGERRFRAAKLAKLSAVPVIIRELSDKQALELALVENIQRQDLNPLEEAAGYQRLMDEFDYTQEELASTVGKSRSHIANLLRLQGLPESIKLLVDKGEISSGHARALLGASDAEAIAKRIVAEGLSVRQTEQLVKGPEKLTEKAPEKQAEKALDHIAKSLEQPSGLKQGIVAPVQANSSALPTAVEVEAAMESAKQLDASIAQSIRPTVTSAAKSEAKSDDVLALEEMLSSSLGLHVAINSAGNQRGEVVIGYSSLIQLDEILRRLGGGA